MSSAVARIEPPGATDEAEIGELKGDSFPTTKCGQCNDSRSDLGTKALKNDPENMQAGIQRAEILRQTWSKTALIIAFAGLFLCTFVITFSNYSTQVYQPYATSAFKRHSAMSAARVAWNIASICANPIVAKLGDVFGRAEMFVFSFFIQILSYILTASCKDIAQYIIAQFLDSVGNSAFGITQQVFIADATNLINRGLWSTLPDSLSAIPTLYLGTIVGDAVLSNSTWQWGYGMWAIILPVCAIPLVATMILLQRRAIKAGLGKTALSAITGSKKTDPLWKKTYQLLWVQLDLPGAILLVAGLSLFLIPLSLTSSGNSQGWKEPSFIAMLVLGVVLFIAFLVWDGRFAEQPFVPYRMVKNRTVVAACVLGALDFFHYSVFSIFFPSYLQVVGGFSPGHASRIDNSLRVSYQVAGLFVAVFMKYSKRSQIWVLMGVPMCVLGQGILIYLIDMGGGRSGNEASFVAAKALIGIGRGFYQTASQVSVQAVVSRGEVAVATGVFFAAMSVGGAIGTSISGAIWQALLPQKLEQYLPPDTKHKAAAIFKSIVTAQEFSKGTPERDAIDRSYRESQRILAIAGISALAPMLVVMLFLKNVKLDKKRTEAERTETDTEIDEANGRKFSK